MQKLNHHQLGALVKQAQKGDTTAFASLYAATVRSQLYFATTFLKDSVLAEDAVQEVYLSLYENLHKIQDGKLFVAYLHRICYNTCVDFRKKMQKQKFELNDDVLATQFDTNLESNPDDHYVALEQSSELYRELTKIPDDHRAAFLMRYFDEMKISQIASAMNLSESTVKRYVKSASETLRKKL